MAINNLYNPTIQGVSVYAFNSKTLDGLVRWLTNANGLGDLIGRFYNNPTTYIRGIKIFPFKDMYTPSMYITSIECNDITIKYFPSPSSSNTDDFKGWRITSFQKSFHTITVNKKYNDFRDYEPYTTCRIYIPFLGEFTLSCEDAYAGIDINVRPNLATGSALFTVTRHADNVMLIRRNAQIGFDVNIGGTDNYATALRNLTSWASYLSAGAINLETPYGGVKTQMPTIEGGWQGALSKGIKYGAKTIADTLTNGMKTEYTSISTSDVETEFYTELDAIIYVTRSDTIRATNAQHYDGYPLLKTGKLKNFKGYTRVNDIHTNVSATSDEQEQITNLLTSGVVL